jgi:hypothetical protein
MVFILLKNPYFHFPRDSYCFTGCSLDDYWSKVPAPMQYVIEIGRSVERLFTVRGQSYLSRLPKY